MKPLWDTRPRIEEMVFFTTDKIDFYILLAREAPGNYYLAGRFCSEPGEKKVFSLSGQDPKKLREKMVVMGTQIAHFYNAHCAYVVFPLGLSVEEFMKRLREAKSESPLPWTDEAFTKYLSLN